MSVPPGSKDLSPEPTGQAKMDNEAASETVRPQSFPELPNILKNASKLASSALKHESDKNHHPHQLKRLAILRDALGQCAELTGGQDAALREAEIYSQLKKLQAKLEEREAGMESAFEPLLKFIREKEPLHE